MKDVSSVTSSTPAPSAFVRPVRAGGVNDRFELRSGVNNLLDKSPSVIEGAVGRTRSRFYDIVGRPFFVGAKAKF